MPAKNRNRKKSSILSTQLFRSLYTSRFKNETMAVVYLLSMLFTAGFFLQVMMMPYIAKQLSITIGQLGFAQSITGLLQVAGSFISGLIAVKYSAKWSLILCYISAFLSQIITFFAKSRSMLYIGMIPQMFMNGQQCDMRMLTKLTKSGKERTEAFSKVGLMFGFGFLLSTVLSITVIKLFGERSVFIAAAFLSITELLLFNNYVADQIEMKTESYENSQQNKKKMSIGSLKRLCGKNQILNLYVSKAMLVGSTIFTMSIIQIYLINSYNISPTSSSLIQAYFGLLLMVSNGFVIPMLRRRYNEIQLFILGAILLVLGNAVLIKAASMWLILLLTFFLCLGMSLSGTTADSIITGSVDKNDEEAAISVIISTDTIIRALAPGISGYLLENFDISIFGMIGCAVSIATIINNSSELKKLILSYL